MAYTTIDDPSAHFQIDLYTGDGQGSGNNVITNDGNSDLQPDWIWTKERTSTSGNQNHTFIDTSRGINKQMFGNLTSADATSSNFITQIDSDGFRLGDNANINNNSSNYVAWQWKANGGTTSSNSDGSLASTVQANTTAGFSIVTWTADGGGAKTIGHGLSAVPKWIITKNRTDDSTNWQIYHSSNTSAPETEVIYFTVHATQDYDGFMADTAPTSSVFTVGGDGSMNGTSGKNIIAYCFTDIQGYSKFGSYAGNNSTNGPFVYTGFTPAWVMIKRTDGGTNNWPIWDYQRGGYNGARAELYANLTNAEATDSAIDILSNGFKLRNASTEWNNGTNYIYMAFAEHPFVSSEGVPVTAR